MSSVGKKLGFNNSTPTHTFDIKTDQIDGFSIKSDKPTNNNIIAQNNSNKGIVVKTGDSTSSLNFFNDNSIQNGIIGDAGNTLLILLHTSSSSLSLIANLIIFLVLPSFLVVSSIQPSPMK